ncbi:MAG TPA: right-handed parallel beta-helix repeat-containing protein, partial [Planctomycetota bacterium]|nr:right-handed parallel beta-helix repeat-containing protein [Planctomycetota bacterium]
MAQLNPLARFLAALCVSAGAPAQIVVSTLADSGPGSLRAAILTVSSSSGSQFTIRLDVAGTCRLASALPYLPSGKSVAIVAGFGSGRFEIDATAASANPVHGLLVRGAGSHLAAPLTVRLRNGVGVEVAFGAHDVRIDDLQVFGGGTGLKATAVANLRVRGVWAAGSGVGIHLENCTGARLGDAATGAQVAATGSLMQGILVQGGADNAFEVFTCADAPGSVVPGVLAVDTTDLVLGAPNGPRSAARDHGAHGVRFVRVTRGLLQHADLDRNGIAGVGIDGGAGNRVQDVRCDHNARSGIELGQDARSTTIGPAVVCSNTAGGQGAGLVIGATRDTRVVDSHFGPNNSPGVHVIPSAAGVSIEGGSIHDNFTGVFVSGVGDVSLVGTRI